MSNIASHIHPMISHFPVVLIVTGFIAETLNKFRKQNFFLQNIGYYFQIIGTIAIILAVLTGLIFTDEPKGNASEIGELHERVAYFALGILIISTFFRYYINHKNIVNKKNLNISYILYLLSLIAITYTGLLGGILVYDYLLK